MHIYLGKTPNGPGPDGKSIVEFNQTNFVRNSLSLQLMKRHSKHIITLVLLTIPLALQSQDPVARIWNEIDSVKSAVQTPAPPRHISPWSLSTSVGTSFSYSPWFGSAMQLYTAPHVSYAASDRLAFHGGLMVSRTTPLMNAGAGEISNFNGFTGISAFASASYRVSENLYIHGTGVKSFAMLPEGNELRALEYYDFSVGATYDFGNFSIGASIHRTDRPYYGYPFGNGMFGSPLSW